MNDRERSEAIFAGERPDRLPVIGFGAWGETRDRWLREGMPPGRDHNQLLGTVSTTLALPLDLNMAPAFPVRVLDVKEDYATVVDEYGVTKRMLRAEYDRTEGRISAAGLANTMSHWIDFPVKDMASWKTIYEERFRPDAPGRWPANWAGRKEEFRRSSETRWVTIAGFPHGGLFGGLRQLMGLEGMVFAMSDQPELIRMMVADLTDFWLAALGLALRDLRLDQIIFFEDCCATRGPIISPAAYEEFLCPGYRKVIGGLKEMGVKQFFIDSDGNAKPLIPIWLACGVTGIVPCEVGAGMDAAELRRDYPTLGLLCGIDKRAVARGPEAMEPELRRRFNVAWNKGRYVPRLDHGAPPDISWENIQHYARRYLELAAAPATES